MVDKFARTTFQFCLNPAITVSNYANYQSGVQPFNQNALDDKRG